MIITYLCNMVEKLRKKRTARLHRKVFNSSTVSATTRKILRFTTANISSGSGLVGGEQKSPLNRFPGGTRLSLAKTPHQCSMVFLLPVLRFSARTSMCVSTRHRRVGAMVQEAATARWRSRLVRDQIDIFADSPAAV